MEAKFTPGPWSISDEQRPREIWIMSNERYCAAVGLPHPIGGWLAAMDVPEREANARLIAASPEMYGLLERVLPILQSLDISKEDGDEEMPIVAEIRTLLAKISP